MIDYQSVEIEQVDFGAQGQVEIFQNLKILFTTIEGTVPFDSTFGIKIDFLDEPLPISQAKLIAEYTMKTRKFEPRASVKEVNFEVNQTTGELKPRVVISIVD